MSYRLPRAAASSAPASLPPGGLVGLDPSFSRLVPVLSDDVGPSRTWHVLDNATRLARLGVRPAGTILCVHGNPTWSYLWRRLITEATDRAATGGEAWRVVAVDQLEMGYSERTGLRRPLAQRVRDLGSLTDALELDGPVVTFGHDWGGVISLGWAIDHPGQLASVMLLNTAVHQPDSEPMPAPLRLVLRNEILGLATVTTPGFIDTTLALGHPALDGAVKSAYRAPYRGAGRRGGVGGFVADIPVGPTHPSMPELERIAEGARGLTVPALMLWGPRDPIFSDRYLDDLTARMPHADVHRFESAGHLIAEDVDYASTALDWLASAAKQAPISEIPTLEAVSERVEPAFRPLWSALDELAASVEPALIEMGSHPGERPRVVSWALLSRRVDEIAAGLEAFGVIKGDRVALLVPPGADLTAVLYACVRIGAIVVVADAGLGLRGLTRAVRGAYPEYVIGALPGLTVARALGWPGCRISTTRLSRSLARSLGVSVSLPALARLGAGAQRPAQPGADDAAAILYTSGSTGPAKGVVYTHRQLAAVRDAIAQQYDVRTGTGLVAGFAPFALLGPALGARSVTPDMDVTSPRTLTARAVGAAAAAADATVVFLSPAALTNVVATSGSLTEEGRQALAKVETFLSAGAPVSPALLQSAAELMPNATPRTPYGMTEALLLTDISLDEIHDAEDDARGPGGVCVGTPNAAVRIRISSLDGQGYATGAPSSMPGITGEILASAPHVEDHYYRLWATDSAARRGGVSGERWHRTGDVGHLDSCGRLWVEGRLQHVIVTADGVRTPVGLEQSIESLDEVRRAAVVGVGPRGTERLVAVVETSVRVRGVALADYDFATLVRSRVTEPLAAVFVASHLPTDVRHNSKIDRTLLARHATAILSGARTARL